jgi:predicted O-methyltransferase YrrM
MLSNLRAKLIRAIEEATSGQAARHTQDIADLRREIADLTKRIQEQSDNFGTTVREAIYNSQRNLREAGERTATSESAAWIQQNMPASRQLPSPRQTLEHGLSLAPHGGMALEFGVYTGSTLEVIAQVRDHGSVYGFDSFEGLPEEWRPGFPAGTFAVDDRPDVPGAELVVGRFDDTLPGFLAGHPGPVDFLHVDCDLYSSTKTVLDHVGPRLHPGSVVVFDEYLNYPGWPEHEHKAWLEYVEQTGLKFTYAGYTVDHEQVIVQVLEI